MDAMSLPGGALRLPGLNMPTAASSLAAARLPAVGSLPDDASGRCLACGGGRLRPLLEIGPVPAVVGALWPSQDAARRARTGRLELEMCDDCSHVENVAFDASLVEYDECYENSLHFSPTFQRYAEQLAHRLVETYGLQEKTVLEVGSGKGEFLRMLCEHGAKVGIGYDPSYGGESDADSLRFVRGRYPLDSRGEDFDFLVCRHVLEHLEAPHEMLRGVRASCRRAGVSAYLEVPNAEFTLSRRGQWDLIYPHVSYFTASSLRRLVERSGFEVIDSGVAFDGQFLWLEAKPTSDATASASADAGPARASIERAAAFAAAYEENVSAWQQRLSASAEPAPRAALWGAGAKGTTFLNMVGRDSRVVAVVDINPRKWGSFVPGTGHEVSAPETLRGRGIDTVVVVNDSYLNEISEQLQDLGITADVVSV